MKFKGTGVALVTPFNRDGQVDEGGLRKLVQHQLKNGASFLVVQGTTGESATLNESEKEEVLDIVIDENAGQLPIVLGMGGNDTKSLQEKMAAFNKPGVDAFLSASPHYNKPTQRGIIAHFSALAEVSPLPIILYNVPGRTASNMSAATTIALSKLDKIVAVKEASGDLAQVMEIIENVSSDFAVLSGEDASTMPMIALGAHGVISVVANAFPKEFSNMITAVDKGDLATARELHYRLLTITNQLFEEGNPAGIKFCLQCLDICQEYLRLPLVGLSDGLKDRMRKELKTKQLN